MPYKNEIADKTSHIDIVKNPDVQEFLRRCHENNFSIDSPKSDITSLFITPTHSNFKKPKNVLCIDGSPHETSIVEKFPSKKIGFIKIGEVLLNYDSFDRISIGSSFVDPFEVAKFTENNNSHTLILPSSNIVCDDCEDVRESFRKFLDEQFDKLRTEDKNPASSLRTTLFLLASYLEDCSLDRIKLSKCPSCGKEDVFVSKIDVEEKGYSVCPHCEKPLYVTDILRIWEQVQIEGMASSFSSITRTMLVTERLIVINYIHSIVEKYPDSFTDILEDLCFFIDGPLAIFGEPAKLHSSIMKYLEKINIKMRQHGKTDILIMGIQKSGAINDFFEEIKEFIPNNTIYPLTDDFRKKYMNCDKQERNTYTYGAETYFGQDFLYKNNSGKALVFNVPYPWADKSSANNFKIKKSDINNYKNIGLYTDLLNDFDCEMYENSLIPTALAHKYTAISLAPGSKVLDLLAKSNISNR